jgi:hypothetical protein
MASRAARADAVGSLRLEESATDERSVVVFKDSQARAEQFATGHDDDIEAWCDVISTEDLSNQTLSTVSDDCAAESLRGGDAEPANRQPVRFREQRVVTA